MRLAVVGSRNYEPLEDVRIFIRSLTPETVIISGGARGVDRTAAEEAKKRGLAVEVFLPNWAMYPRSAGLIRNSRIVDECDELVAFWDGKSPGTRDSVKKASNVGKLRALYRCDNPRQGQLF